MTRRLAVVYEAPPDLSIAAEIADRVLCSAINWLDESLLDSQREWVAEHPPGARLTWTSIAARAKELGIKVHGHFDGQPGFADAQAARRALTFLLRTCGTLNAILLIRDADNQIERRTGLEQARQAHESAVKQGDATDVKIVIGLAIRKREAWVISGFEPDTDDERERLAAEVQNLGFDPRVESQELTAGSDVPAKRDPKRVLAVLTNNDLARQQRCWTETPLSTLRVRGKNNGLAEFMREIESVIVPLVTGHTGKSGET